MSLLPPDAVRMLQVAQAHPNEEVRRKATDAAIDSIKLKYPSYFRQEQDHETDQRTFSIPRFIRSKNR